MDDKTIHSIFLADIKQEPELIIIDSDEIKTGKKVTVKPPFTKKLSKKITLDSSSGYYQCPECNKAYSSEKSVKEHLRKIHNPNRYVQCHICQRQLVPHSLKLHLLIHTKEKSFECYVCQKTFARKVFVQKHLKIHYGERNYGCDLCNKFFPDKGQINEHMVVHTGIRRYTCNICQKAYPRISTLRVHEQTHKTEKRHKCRVCEKSFSRYGQLKRHLNVHTGDRPFKCPLCEKAFKSYSGKRKHVTTRHSTNRPFKCDICGKAFKTKSSCQMHLMRCAKRPTKDRQISTNLLNVTIEAESGRKLYTCICKKVFNLKSSYIEHNRLHTGEKPFQCTVCHKSFAQKSCFRFHLKRHADINQPKLYKCFVCKKSFDMKCYLDEHLKVEHTEHKFWCDICNHRPYASKYYVSRHMETIHSS